MKRRALLSNIYAALPVFAQNAAFSFWGAHLKHQRYGGIFEERLSSLKETQWWSPVEIQDYQDAALQRLIEHCYDTVPYYRMLMDAKHLSPQDFRTVEDLPKLPLLTKQDIKRVPMQFISSDFRMRDLVESHTGGTTGTPLTLWLTREALQFQWAVWWRHRSRFGLALGDHHLVVGARLPLGEGTVRPPFWRYDRAMNRTYLSNYHQTPANLPEISRWLMNEPFVFYSGLPSALFVLARWFRDHGHTLSTPLKAVVCGSNSLLPGFEKTISQAFRVPVTDQYGMGEACGNIAQCEKGTYHLDAEFGIAELLPVPGMESTRWRRLVFTGLANMAMPLIRYDIGDLALISDAPCDCGRSTLCFDRIEGRTEDYVRTPDGRMAVGVSPAFKAAEGIEGAQIRQDKIDHIKVLVIPGPEFTSRDLQILESGLRSRLGYEIGIEFEMVSHIPAGPNGKVRAVVSSLPPASREELELSRAVNSETLD